MLDSEKNINEKLQVTDVNLDTNVDEMYDHFPSRHLPAQIKQ